MHFHFHHISEHTINGDDVDLEMHISQKSSPPATKTQSIKSAPVGIFFSVDKYDSTLSGEQMSALSTFFENLKLDNRYDDKEFFFF